MRDLIKKELAKVAFADLSHYDETTGVFNIPRYTKPQFEIGKMYLIQVANELVKNNSSVIASNWNSGTSPQDSYLKVYVGKKMGVMIYVDSLVFNMATKQDTAIMWSGWLPVDKITQLAKI